jgi:hypothetical protein
MSEEIKSSPLPEGEKQSAGQTPAAPPPPATPKTDAPAPSAPPKPAAPAKPAGPVPLPWDSPMVAKYKRQFGTGLEALTYLGQNYLTVDRSMIPDILRLLRDEEHFDYCVDITAVHYPKREKQFDLLRILYSHTSHERMRVKQIAENDSPPVPFPSGQPPTGWSAKCSTCLESSLKGILT